MKTLMITTIIVFVLLGIYFLAILLTDPVAKKDKHAIQDILTEAYTTSQISPNWKTLVIAATREIEIPTEDIWEVFQNLEEWPTWSSALHESASWKSNEKWVVGAEFNQVLKLGAPIGTQLSEEKITKVITGEKVVWSKDKDGIKACHIWKFEALPNGKTRVTNCEVFHGLPIAVISPFAANRWNNAFNEGMDNLLEKVANKN